MFKKLRNSMLMFNMITISLVIVAAFSVVYFATYRNIESKNKNELQAMSSLQFAPNRDGNEGWPGLSERFSADYRVSFILYIKNGSLDNINSHLDFDDSVYEEALEKIGTKRNGKISLANREWAFMTSEASSRQSANGSDQYERVVFLDITSGVETLRELLITLSCVGIVVLLTLFWFSYRFAVRAIRPIEESYNKQKQFIADASHEFKTPLAIIGANIDAIEASANESVESQKEWFGYIRAELKRASKLVDSLLYLAKAENIKQNENTPVNLSHACETACASMEAILYDCGISLEPKIKENIFITADGEKIMQVLYILLDNAGKYTQRGGSITFLLELEHEWAVIKVSNTGTGITSEDLPKIFDRFYRPDVSRSQETGGFGLGLSIAKTIVERSGGEISAESGGEITTFTVRFKHN